MPTITISYRRADTGAIAGRICERLTRKFGKESVFMDIDSIPLGVNFLTHMNAILGKTDILIAIVGKDWIGAEPDGSRHIEKETDFVRIEVETALKRGIPIIPVLVSGAEIPNPDALPAPLRDFAYYNATAVDYGRDFDVHMDRLILSTTKILGATRTKELRNQIGKLWKSADEIVSAERRAELRTHLNKFIKSADDMLSAERKIEFNFRLKPKMPGEVPKYVKYAAIALGVLVLFALIGSLGGR